MYLIFSVPCVCDVLLAKTLVYKIGSHIRGESSFQILNELFMFLETFLRLYVGHCNAIAPIGFVANVCTLMSL